MERRRYEPTWLPQELLFQVLALEHNWIGFTGEGLPFPVAMSLGRSSDGRLICTGLVLTNLTIGAQYDDDVPDHMRDEPLEITSRLLRKLPLGELVGSVAAMRDDPEGEAFFRRSFALADNLPALPRRRPGPKGHPPEHFQVVADAYRAALAHAPRKPIKTVAEQLHASEATVRRWVQRARDKGLLGESTPGKAGERTAVRRSVESDGTDPRGGQP
jgi:hypothetical protein